MNLKTKDFFYVGIQLLLFVVYLFNVNLFILKIPYVISIIGLALCVAGVITFFLAILQLNKNLSPFPSPKSNSELIQTGLYKYIRHPIYTGIILVTFGYGLFVDSLYKIIISVALYILFIFKSRYEEEQLKLKFPDYKAYKKSCGRFFPKL